MPRVSGQTGGFRLDTSQFTKFVKKLSEETGASWAKVLEHETLKALQTAAEKVGSSTLAKSGGKFNPGSKYFKGWVRMNGKFYYVGPTANGKTAFKYSASMWSQLMRRLAANRKRAETRVTLSRAAFYRAAALLKLKRYSAGWNDGRIKGAYNKSGGMGSAGRNSPVWARTISAKKNLRGPKQTCTFKIDSTNTFNPTTKGAGKLQSALNGRERFFKYAVEKDWRKRTDALARAYPGIDVK